MSCKIYIDKARRGFSSVSDYILPARCPVNGRIVPDNGAISPESWRDLTFVSAPFCRCCGYPFPVVEQEAQEGSAELLCGPCLETEPSFGRARSVFVYDDASRQLVLSFKHGDRTLLTRTFAPLMARAGEVVLAEADLLVPVPLHWVRLLKRRYNQAALLASALSQLSGLPHDPFVLQRTRHTASQGHKSAKDRVKNVQNAFAVDEGRAEKINGRRIVLVDDVLTTGATVEACARALSNAGAAGVDVLTVARVVKT